MRSVLLSVVILAALAGIGDAGDAVMLSGDPLMLPDGCAECDRQPPWHRNVRPPVCGLRGCGPAMSCPPQCDPCQNPCHDPCCEPECYVLPPCFPRLHALFRQGYLLSPTPPRPPRCPQCGCHIPHGF